MRVAKVLVATLLIAGCEHMYGAEDLELTDSEAMEIAQDYAARRGLAIEGRVPVVGHHGDGTTIELWRPECLEGPCSDLPLSFYIPMGKRRVAGFHDGQL